MVRDCDEPASVKESALKTGPPEARGPGDEIIEIEEGLYQVLASLLALAQEQCLSTLCQSLSSLKQDTEESLLSGYSPIFCPTFPANAHQVLSEFRFLLDLKVCTARLPAEELRTKSTELEKYLAYTEWEFKDAQVVFKNEAARLAGVYAMCVSQFVEATSRQLSDEIREQFRLLEGVDRSERGDRMNSFLQARLQEQLGSWQSPFEESSMELFQHAAIRFAKHACELFTGIRSNTRSLFGASAETEEWCEGFEESNGVACLRDHGPECFFNDTWLYFSATHFRKHLLRNVLRNASCDFLSYASRAVEDHKSHLDKCCIDLLKRMTEQLNEAREGICSIVEGALCKAEGQGKFVSAEHELEGERKAIDTLRQYEGQLNLLLCRWESVGDTVQEGRLNSRRAEAGSANRNG